MATNKIPVKNPEENETHVDKLMCGIIMPIASFDGCSDDHWTDVRGVLEDSINSVGFLPNLVSNSSDVGIIHKRIIQNLHDNPVVVCDVSGRNPNVMFELGLRLAFDMPTIIIKDDKTPYSFDTSPIEHLEYPRDLRFTKIVDFKASLAEKIKSTYDRSKTDPNYTTFLKHFGTFKVAKLDKEEVSASEYLLEEFRALRATVMKMNSSLFNEDASHNRVRYLVNSKPVDADAFNKAMKYFTERENDEDKIIQAKVNKFTK